MFWLVFSGLGTYNFPFCRYLAMDSCVSYFSPFSETDRSRIVECTLAKFGKEECVSAFKRMIIVRELENRGEAAYLDGKIGGFYHSYAGQEAIAAALITACGKDNYIFSSYRCHAYALETGVSPREIAAELLGKSTGCALGRGGSMHMCSDTMPGGFGIVGGQVPLAIGGAFSAKYLKNGLISIAVLGDGAVAQGAFHESLNYASLHSLPVLFLVENNLWGMGTAVHKAISLQPIWKSCGDAYKMSSYLLNGMDFFNCLGGFQTAYEEIKEKSRPVIIECSCSRFRGHSISDSNSYRTSNEMKQILTQDPLLLMNNDLIGAGVLQKDDFDHFKKSAKQIVLDAFQYAESSPEPSITELEEYVYAP